jgi:hypothetical protein
VAHVVAARERNHGLPAVDRDHTECRQVASRKLCNLVERGRQEMLATVVRASRRVRRLVELGETAANEDDQPVLGAQRRALEQLLRRAQGLLHRVPVKRAT